jgi:hypothetical protein
MDIIIFFGLLYGIGNPKPLPLECLGF